MGPISARRPLAKLRAFGAHCFTPVTLLAVTALAATGLAATAALDTPAASASSRAASSQTVNAAPQVQPPLKQWQGGAGTVTLTPATKILVDQRYTRSLSSNASAFAQDVQSVTDLKIPVAVSSAAEPGDFFLTLGASGAGSQGYQLDLGNSGISIAGQTSTGVFYGEQTILQMLRLSSSGRSLPQGTAADSPDYSYRGVMLDSGRKYWSVAYIQRLIRQMAWLKLNTLHWHLAEWNAFRLNSPEYPGLAAPQSYTKADVDAVLATARRYHVTVIPEIDVPAHSDELTSYNPALRWSCRVMNDSTWGSSSGFTVDITKPQNVAWLDKLLTTFMSWFPGQYFHFGGDEYQTYAEMESCPELVSYAKSHGFASVADVFVAFEDHIGQLAQSHGKKAIIWNFWDSVGNNTITPNKDLTIEAWTKSPQTFLDEGYTTVGTGGGQLYVSPHASPGNLYSTADPSYIYEDWAPIQNPLMKGYELDAWTNQDETQPDAYMDWFLQSPMDALGARLWGGPRANTVSQFEDELAQIGPAPGITPNAPAGSLLAGSSYGSGAAGSGYAGTDLGAGNARKVVAIRFAPAEDTLSSENQMVGGRFQGCTEGPDQGCHDLAVIRWRPVSGWNDLTVTDQASYRWLQYVPPAGGSDSTGAIQFYGAPVSNPLSMTAPSALPALGKNSLVTTFTNPSGTPIYDLELCVSDAGKKDFTVLPVTPEASRGASPQCAGPLSVVPAGATVRVTWDIKVPATAVAGGYTFYGRAAWADGNQPSASLHTTTDVIASTVPRVVKPTLGAPSVNVQPGGSATAALSVASQSAKPLSLSWKTDVPSGSGVSFGPASGQVNVPAFGKASVQLQLNATTPGVFSVPVTLTTAAGGYIGSVTLRVSVAFPGLAAAFNNVAITDNANVDPPDLGDGLDGYGASFSAQELATHGLTPGAAFSYKGFAFQWPGAAAGNPDNVMAGGQTITLHGQGSALGLLVTGTSSPAAATGTITYSDGTVQPFTLTVPNWRTAAPPATADPAITAAYYNEAGLRGVQGQVNGTAYIYLVTLPLNPAKTVASVTLPVVPGIAVGDDGESAPTNNVFAMAIR
jgi:hypothetical protein